MIEITIPGEPVGQGRPRATVGKDGKPRMYSPKASTAWRKRAAQYMKAAVRAPFEGPVKLDICAFFAVPKSRERKREGNQIGFGTPCTKKPDFDNVAKAVCDAGNGILFVDDAQVVDCRVRKAWAGQSVEPRVTVWIEELP